MLTFFWTTLSPQCAKLSRILVLASRILVLHDDQLHLNFETLLMGTKLFMGPLILTTSFLSKTSVSYVFRSSMPSVDAGIKG